MGLIDVRPVWVGGVMLMQSYIRNLLHLPSRIALLLGLSALSVAGAKADNGGDPHPDRTRVPQQSARPLADIAIWVENGRIYLSEAGKPVEELRLGNAAEAGLLAQMLNEKGATAVTPHVLHDRIILVGGGGDGFHWTATRADDPNQTPIASSHNSDKLPATAKDAGQTSVSQAPGGTDNRSK
jgi:hypothetical protein